MTTTDPRLAELIEAASILIDQGGSVTNRNRLKAALFALDAKPLDLEKLIRPRLCTPAVSEIIAKAAQMADASNDVYVRIQHLEFAMREVNLG